MNKRKLYRIEEMYNATTRETEWRVYGRGEPDPLGRYKTLTQATEDVYRYKALDRRDERRLRDYNENQLTQVYTEVERT